jgi:DNA-binding CsgD family transcriptional regulator
MDDALAAHGHENPLSWRRWKPSDGAKRLLTSMSRHDLHRLAFYNEVMRPERLTDILKVWVWSSSESVACVQLWRHGGQFSRRDEDVLAVLQSHLAHVRVLGLRRRSAVPRAGPPLTVREAEIVMWAVTGAGDAAIAQRLGMSEATVGKHLEHAYEKLGVHSRAEALWRMTAQTPWTERQELPTS